MSHYEAAVEDKVDPAAWKRKIGGGIILVGGLTLLLVSRSSKALLTRLNASAADKSRKPRLKDLNPGKRPSSFQFDFISNNASPAPASLSKFMLDSVQVTDKELPPKSDADNFNAGLYAFKAFGYATLITLSVFGSAAAAIAYAWDIHDLASLRIQLKERMPRIMQTFVPTSLAGYVEPYKTIISPSKALNEDHLREAYERGGFKAWFQELEVQSARSAQQEKPT